MRGSGVGGLGLGLQLARRGQRRRGLDVEGGEGRLCECTNRARWLLIRGIEWDKRLCTTKGWMQDGREETKTKTDGCVVRRDGGNGGVGIGDRERRGGRRG